MRITTIFILLISSFFLYSQEDIPSLFTKVMNDDRIQSYQVFENSLLDKEFSYPLVEEINFRTSTDRNIWARQEYLGRVVFNNFGLRRHLNNQKTILLEKHLVKKSELLQDLYFGISKQIIDLHFISQKRGLLARQVTTTESRLARLILLVNGGNNVDADDIIRVEQKIFDINQEGQILEQKYSSLLTSLGAARINTSSILSIDRVISTVNNMSIDKVVNLDIKLLDIDITKSQNDYNLRRREGNRILDFVQIQYGGRENLLFNQEFSFGLGIRVPYRGSISKQKAELLLNTSEINLQKSLKTSDVKNKIISLKNKFDLTHKEYLYFKNQNQQIVSQLNPEHPESALAIEQFKAELEVSTTLKLLELEKELWDTYLDILRESCGFTGHTDISL
jgi:hypothetical protein